MAPVNDRRAGPLNDDGLVVVAHLAPVTMPFSVNVLVSVVLAGACAAACAAPDTAPHAASCVAALEAQETSLAQSVKAGESVAGDTLLKVVRSGIAIIGTQYMAGLREAEARQLLKAAQQEFEALPPAAASERQVACLREGESLFEHASSLERTLITTAAQHRIKRITAVH